MSIDDIIKKIIRLIRNILAPYVNQYILNFIISLIKIMIIIPLSIINTCFVFIVEIYELLGEIWTHMIYTGIPLFFINQLSITQQQFSYLFSWTHFHESRGGGYIFIIFFVYIIRRINTTNINYLFTLYQKYPKPFSFIRKSLIIICVTPVLCGLLLCYLLGLLLFIDQFLFQLLMEFNYPLLIFMFILAIIFYYI